MSRHAPRDEWLLPTLAGLVASPQLAELRRHGDHLWEAAVSLGLTSDDAIVGALATRFRIPIADLASVSTEARDALGEALARKYHVVPLAVTATALDVATASPNDLDSERALAFATGRAIRVHVAAPARIAARLDELYQPDQLVNRLIAAAGDAELERLGDTPALADFDVSATSASARPIIRLVDHIIAEGITQRASDIHLEVQERGVQVTLRIDGVLRPAATLPRALGTPLVSRVKIMSGLDIADRLRPQDGRARVSIGGRRIDLRVSTLPASTGEKVVIRILDSTAVLLRLDALGIEGEDLARIQHLVGVREGIILVTGPTGSGKTTTLYSALKAVQARGVNIVTVEDPVEYKLPGIVQVQVNEKAGLTFASALRSILRQDPDVVLVGEIRDLDTASIAIQASLTGHLVFSTLHTIDASSSVARLLDIGIDAYKIGAALKGVISQRLVRRLCERCRQPRTDPLPAHLRRLVPRDASIFRAGGCEDCGESGYRGRLALVEVLVADDEVERRIAAGDRIERISEAARAGGMRSLWDSGLDRLLAGVTDLEELVRVVEVPPDRLSTGRSGNRTRRMVSPAVEAGKRDSAIIAPLTNHHLQAPTADLVREPAGEDRAEDGPSVLVVGRAAEELAALRQELWQHGLRVDTARDLGGALDAVGRHVPRAIVVELRSLGRTAASEARRLLSLPGHPRVVIVLPPPADEESEVALLDAGAADVLFGPVNPRVLSARLRALLGVPAGTDAVAREHVMDAPVLHSTLLGSMPDLRVGVVDVFVLDPAGGLKVLLLRRGTGTRCTGAWEVVHGRIEGTERPEDAAVREVLEECGLPVDRLYNVICQAFYLHRLSTVQVAVVFAAFADSRRAVTLGDEHDRAEWLAPDEAEQRLTWPRSRQAMRDVVALLGTGDAGVVEDVLRIR